MIENIEEINKFNEYRHTKDIYKKVLLELINEKQNIIIKTNEDYTNRINKIIESIEHYLIIAQK